VDGNFFFSLKKKLLVWILKFILKINQYPMQLKYILITLDLKKWWVQEVISLSLVIVVNV